MKNSIRNIAMAFVLFLTFSMLAGCDTETKTGNENKSGNDDSFEWIMPVGDIDMAGMNLFMKYENIQFFADENAKLSIYVCADIDENGEILFDDGQDWLVLMETSFGDYPLFPRQRVQLGAVSCVIFNDYVGEETVQHVLVSVRQTAGYEIYDCVFNNEKGAYLVVPVYDAQAINLIAS